MFGIGFMHHESNLHFKEEGTDTEYTCYFVSKNICYIRLRVHTSIDIYFLLLIRICGFIFLKFIISTSFWTIRQGLSISSLRVMNVCIITIFRPVLEVLKKKRNFIKKTLFWCKIGDKPKSNRIWLPKQRIEVKLFYL